jgi:hypothetical protein
MDENFFHHPLLLYVLSDIFPKIQKTIALLKKELLAAFLFHRPSAQNH